MYTADLPDLYTVSLAFLADELLAAGDEMDATMELRLMETL